jgi:hypothetical protein
MRQVLLWRWHEQWKSGNIREKPQGWLCREVNIRTPLIFKDIFIFLFTIQSAAKAECVFEENYWKTFQIKTLRKFSFLLCFFKLFILIMDEITSAASERTFSYSLEVLKVNVMFAREQQKKLSMIVNENILKQLV